MEENNCNISYLCSEYIEYYSIIHNSTRKIQWGALFLGFEKNLDPLLDFGGNILPIKFLSKFQSMLLLV